jgi:hypothetical protein
MTLALIDVPRCLNVDTTYVGPARASVTSSPRAAVWSDAVQSGGTAAYRRRAVEECLDTIGVLRSYREPQEGETWFRPAESERRLLAQVNAILALGDDALTQVAALALDPEVPDAGRVFGALFTLGCAAGRRRLDSARDIFVAAVVRTPGEAGAAIEAWSLSPNPDIVTLLAALLTDERPRVRAGATRVLAFRGALSEGQWHHAMRDADPSVAAAALSAPLQQYDRVACHRLLQPFFTHESESLTRLALRAGFSLGLDAAYVSAHDIVRKDPGWAGAAHLLALVGNLPIARVRELFSGPNVVAAVRAAGSLGSLDLVADLIALFDRADAPELVAAARQALTTITGLVVDAENANQALRTWSQHASRFQPTVRYRYGRPWSLDVLLQLLRSGPGVRSGRQEGYFEMQAATASRLPRFSAYDFVAVQSRALGEIERWLADDRGRAATEDVN